VTTPYRHVLPKSSSHWSLHPYIRAGIPRSSQKNTLCSLSPLERGLNGLTQDNIRKRRFLLPSLIGESFEGQGSAQGLSNPDTNKAWLMYSIRLYSTECYRVKLGETYVITGSAACG
jgi:hypothetical protein